MEAVNRKQWPVVAGALAYAAAGLVAVSLDAPAKGYAVLACSLAGVVGVVLIARATGRTEWLAALTVLIPLSIFQVLPDWLLATGLHTIEFPDNGGLRIGAAIPLAMAGLWVLPLLVVVRLAKDSLWRGALISAAVFFATELIAPSIELWRPLSVHEFLGSAIYVVPAEAALGAATVYAVRVAARSNWTTRIVAALSVSIFYTGALALSWLLIDGGRMQITF